MDLLQDLIENEEKREILGSQNLQRALAFFSIGTMVENYRNLYAKVLDS